MNSTVGGEYEQQEEDDHANVDDELPVLLGEIVGPERGRGAYVRDEDGELALLEEHWFRPELNDPFGTTRVGTRIVNAASERCKTGRR